MKWKLIKCEEVDWKQDGSGVYTIINVVKGIKLTEFPQWRRDRANMVRLDILTSDHTPAISFQGTASAVRKNAMRYAENKGLSISLEHAAYIGAELARAALLGKYYVQD